MRSTLFAFALVAACSSSSSGDPSTKTDTGSVPIDTATSDDTLVVDSASDTSGDAIPTDVTPTGDTWTSWASGFFVKYCTESGCHDSADPTGRDFSIEAKVKANASTIRCGVAPTKLSGCTGSPAPRQFPINDSTGTNPKPPDDERNRIVAWIDAGMP